MLVLSELHVNSFYTVAPAFDYTLRSAYIVNVADNRCHHLYVVP